MDPLKSSRKAVADADVVAFGGVGIASQILPETAAYFALAERAEREPQAVRPHLDRLLRKATPAGRVYAATLLATIDRAAGAAAWQKLVGDRSPVRTMMGCIAGETTLGEYAERELSRRS